MTLKRQFNQASTTPEYTKNIKNAEVLNSKLEKLNSHLGMLSKIVGMSKKDFGAEFDYGKTPINENNINKFISKMKTAPEVSAKDLQDAAALTDAAKAVADINKLHADNSAEYVNTQEALNTKVDAYTRQRVMKNQASSRWANFSDQMINNAAFMGSYALLGAGTSLMTGAVGSVLDFQDRLKNLQAITGSTTGEMGVLTKAVEKVAVTTKFSASEISDAATILGQAGYSATNIKSSLGGVVKLATATGSSLQDSTQTMTSALTIWNKAYSDSASVANEFTAAVNKSKLDINSLGLALQYSGNIAAQGNIPLKDVVTITALMKDAGIKRGSTLGTGQRMLFSDIIAPSKKFTRSLQDADISLQEFNKVFNNEGVIGVFKFMKKSGYNFKDATKGMEIRERTAYAAVSNQIDKAEPFRQSITGTQAAENANAVQLSSTKNRFKNMINSWAIQAFTGTEGLLSTSGSLFKFLTVNTKSRDRTLFTGGGKQYIDNLGIPKVATSGGVGLTTSAALAAAAAYYGLKHKASLTSRLKANFGSKGSSLSDLFSGVEGEAGESMITNLVKSVFKKSILGLGVTAAMAYPHALAQKDKTGSTAVGAVDLSASIAKAAAPLIAGSIAAAPFTGGTSLAVGAAAALGTSVIQDSLGVNSGIDKLEAWANKKIVGTSAKKLFQDIAITASGYASLQSDLQKTSQSIKKDKSLNILKTIDTSNLVGSKLTEALAKNRAITEDNENKNLLSLKTAYSLAVQYNKQLTDLNSYMGTNVKITSDITLDNKNNAKQLIKNIALVQKTLVEARTKYSKGVLKGITSNDLYARPSKDVITKVTSDAKYRSVAISNPFNKPFDEIARVSPILYGESNTQDIMRSETSAYLKVLRDKTGFGPKTNSDMKNLEKQIIDGRNKTAVAAVLTSNNSELLAGILKQIDTAAENNKQNIYSSKRSDIRKRLKSVLADQAGYRTFLGDLGDISNLKESFGKAVKEPLDKIDTAMKQSFTQFNRVLGIEGNKFTDSLAKSTLNAYREIKNKASDVKLAGLDKIFKSSAAIRRFISSSDTSSSYKNLDLTRLNQVNTNVKSSEDLGSSFKGTIDALKTPMNEALELSKLDLKVMKSIDSFVNNMAIFKDIGLNKNNTLIHGADQASSAFEYKFKKGLQAALDANAPSSEKMALSAKIYKENLGIRRQNALDINRLQTTFKSNQINLNASHKLEALDRNYSFNLESIGIKVEQQKEALSRRYNFNLGSLAIQTQHAIRDAGISKSRNLRNLNLSDVENQASIGRSKQYAIQDLNLKKVYAIADLNLQTARRLEDISINYTRQSEDVNISRSRNLEKVKVGYSRQTENIGIAKDRNILQAGIHFERAVVDLNKARNYAITDATKNYARQVQQINLNYQRTIDAIGVADKFSNLQLALDANKAKLAENTTAIKQWININKTKEDLVKAAYQTAYKASGGDVNSAIFNKTYKDLTSMGIDRAQSGYGYDVNKALVDPNYIKNQVANPGVQVTAASAAVGNQVTTQDIVKLLYGMANGSYRTTSTVGAVTSAKGDMGSKLYDLQTSMVKLDLQLRDSGIRYTQQLQDSATKQQYILADLTESYNRKLEKINLDQKRALEDINTKFQQAMEDTARRLTQAEQDVATNFSQAMEDLSRKRVQAEQDVHRQAQQRLDDLNRNFARSLDKINEDATRAKINQAYSDSMEDITRKAVDMKAQLSRTFSFDSKENSISGAQAEAAAARRKAQQAAEIEIARQQAQEALKAQTAEMVQVMSLQFKQGMAAFQKKQSDTLRMWHIDAKILAHKYAASYKQSIELAMFNATILKQKLNKCFISKNGV